MIRTALILMAAAAGLWWLNTYVPMDTGVRVVANLTVLVVVVLWLLGIAP